MATQPHYSHAPVDIGSFRKIRLRVNKGGYFEVWWADARAGFITKRESTKEKVLAKAEDYLFKFCDDARGQTAALTAARVPRVDELCKKWLDRMRPMGKAEGAKYILAAVCRVLGPVPADQLSGQRLQDYAPQRGGIKDSTLRRELTALKTVLLWAARERLISRDDVPDFIQVVPPEGPPRVRFLDLTQEQWFWDQAMLWGQAGKHPSDYRVWVFVALGLETAARKTAIHELTWDRVDLVSGRIDFHQPGRRLTKKRRVTGLPVSDRLRPVLEEAWQRAGKPLGGPVLGGSPDLRKSFARFTRSVGMPWVTPHVLRHTWGSLAAMDGQPLYDIGKMMGDSVATIERTYLHLTPGHLRAVANFKTRAV